MKSLKNFIYENKINEDVDDNLFWLLDKWFERNENQKSEFIEILIKCRQTGDKVSIDELKKLIHKTEIEKNLKEFINFINNDLEPQNNKDYLYELKMIIEVVIGKKEKNKYLDESKILENKQYKVYVNGRFDKTFSENSKKWKRDPRIGQGWYCGGTVFKIVKIEDDKVYTEEDKNCHP